MKATVGGLCTTWILKDFPVLSIKIIEVNVVYMISTNVMYHISVMLVFFISGRKQASGRLKVDKNHCFGGARY